ncbi:MAG: A24 family peptidase [Firmicutes bacterium]|nr:A24 family peptidase [Bacillota bacterium]
MIECICAIIFVVNFTLYPVIMFVPLTILAFVLLCVASIDYDTQIISDVFIIILAITGIFWLIFAEFLGIMHNIPQNILQNALIAVLVGALPLWIIDKLTLLFLKQDGFGYGDIKLMGVVGLFLGWQLILVAYLFAFVAGGAVATVLLATKQAKPGQYIAFAPFLAIGIMLALWFGKFFIFL